MNQEVMMVFFNVRNEVGQRGYAVDINNGKSLIRRLSLQ